MRKILLYIILFASISCSEKVYIREVKPFSIEQNSDRKVKYLSGKVFPIPQPRKFYSAILFLNYNDSTKIYAGTDFDGNFSFYDFKPKLINNESYIYVANIGCVPKKVLFKDIEKPVLITLKIDSINGLSKKKYFELLKEHRPIDK